MLEEKVRGMEKHPGRVLLVYNWTKYYVGFYDPGINNLLKKSSQRMNSSSMKECACLRTQTKIQGSQLLQKEYPTIFVHYHV